MKKYMVLGMTGVLFMFSNWTFAQSKTNIDAGWVCTTNASSSSVKADKDADDEMANVKKSAKDAFLFAADNCRNCNSIECEVK